MVYVNLLMKCFHCNKEFEAKKDTAKYCSTSCRVMANKKKKRNNVKREENGSLIKMQVIYNSILEAIDTLKDVNNPILRNIGTPQPKIEISHNTAQRISYTEYFNLKLECETSEQWEKLKYKILSDEFLSKKEKISLTT